MKRSAALVVAALALTACSGGDGFKPTTTSSTTTSSSASSGGGGSGGEGATGGAGGQGGGGQGGAGGQGGGKPAPYCGDGNIDPGEQCDDGNKPGGLCSADCKLIGTESEPNDTAAQANAYASPWGASIAPAGDVDVVSFDVAAGPVSLVVETRDIGDGGCAGHLIDTVLDILDKDGKTVLKTDDDGGQGYCSLAVASNVSAGKYFLRVKASPMAPAPTFPYRLLVSTIVEKCGDGVLTPGEQCDDGNLNAGDGCSPACKLEITEVEPNGTPAQANTYKAPWFGVLDSASDADVVTVNVDVAGSSIAAVTGDGGTGACAAQTLDTVLEILGPDGSTVLASNDDAAGTCSFAQAKNLKAGPHYVRVTGGGLDTYPSVYGLSITVSGP